MGGEGRAAMADHTGGTDQLDAFLVAHCFKIVGMDGLMQPVLVVVFNHDGKDLAAVGMETRLDGHDLAGNGRMDRGADKAACFGDGLSHVHDVTHLDAG